METRFGVTTGRDRCGAAARRHREIGEALFSIGVTPHTEGYALLRDGTRLIADGDRYRQIRMTDELYPLLSGCFARHAEHAMRDALHLAWQRDGQERCAPYFGASAPSNAAFLYLLASRIRNDRT